MKMTFMLMWGWLKTMLLETYDAASRGERAVLLIMSAFLAADLIWWSFFDILLDLVVIGITLMYVREDLEIKLKG